MHLGVRNQTHIEPYDFHDVENVDEIVETNHKNGIYFRKWNVMEFTVFFMNKSKADQCT